jgi:hypothetical protein
MMRTAGRAHGAGEHGAGGEIADHVELARAAARDVVRCHRVAVDRGVVAGGTSNGRLHVRRGTRPSARVTARPRGSPGGWPRI